MNHIEKYQIIAEQEISKFAIKSDPSGLYDPIKYVLGIGGKRIRPALCMATCHYYSETGYLSLNAAIGFEVFHNFTLLHDDIMDNAIIRRNKPTVHQHWNVNTAILSGDAMMILASQLMLKVPDNSLRQIQELYLKTGLEVCEGQQMDMDFETQEKVTIPQYLEMIRLKTAVLISASLKSGALIGGASASDCDYIYEFGQNLGLAFQLQDDYLDAYSNDEKFGKAIGGDIVANKKTFLLISCLENANAEILQRLNNCLTSTSISSKSKIEQIKAIYDMLHIGELCLEKIEYFYSLALGSLKKLSLKDEYKAELQQFAEKLMGRTY